MKKTGLILALFLIFTLVSCNFSVEEGDSLWEGALYLEDTELGEGDKKIEVEIVAGEKSITFTLHTDAENLADALLENSLIEGEDSIYGIYIKKVNGITADFDKGGYYWYLSKDGEYLMTSAEATEISDGERFELVRTK